MTALPGLRATSSDRIVDLRVLLPVGVSCSYCVLKMWWKTDLNNNECGEIGCCDQEEYKNCADIAIASNGDSSLETTSTSADTSTQESTTLDKNTAETETETVHPFDPNTSESNNDTTTNESTAVSSTVTTPIELTSTSMARLLFWRIIYPSILNFIFLFFSFLEIGNERVKCSFCLKWLKTGQNNPKLTSNVSMKI